MKRVNTILTVMLALAGFAALSIGYAQQPAAAQKGPNASKEKGKVGASSAVAMLDQAGELVQYARENESPVAMLAAVQMLERVRVQQGSERIGSKKTGLQREGEQVKEGKKGESPEPTLDPQKLLAEAKPWAKGNQQLMTLLDAESARAKPASGGTLGSTQGVIAHPDAVRARSYDDYTISFYARQAARIAVIGDGDTDLDLIVYDENGHEITRDDDNSSTCAVSFTPRWTGPFRVRILNNGYVYSRYILMTN